jgi:outer membrane biosynthesis protein TonB
MPSALTYREPRLLPEGPDLDADAVLTAPAGARAPTDGRAPVGLRPTTVSLLLHLLLVILILIDMRDWWMQKPAAPAPPSIEVTLVQPPPPPAPPQPAVKPPEPAPPPPSVPLSSDAMSEGAKRPSPAEKAEAAPAAREPGPQAAPPRKTETPVATPSTKPAPAEPRHAAIPPPPRSSVTGAPPAPAPASPSQKPAQETETAMSTPPPEPAATARGTSPAEPGTGKAAQSGLSVTLADPPGGDHPAIFDAYLAAVRDKIASQRNLLRTYRGTEFGSRVAAGMVLDDAGRLKNFGIVRTSGSPSLDYTIKNMIALAPAFGPPPPGLIGTMLIFSIELPTTEADWDEMMATGRPPGSHG